MSAFGQTQHSPLSVPAQMIDPVALAHTDRIAASFPVPLDRATAERLKYTTRMREQVLNRLRKHYSLDTAVLGEHLDHRCLVLGPRGPVHIGLMAGAACHGAAIREITSPETLRHLMAKVDRDVLAFGLRHVRRVDLQAAAQPAASDDLPRAILQDGLRCLSSWCSLRPHLIDWVRLRLPGDIELSKPDDHETTSADAALIDAALAVEQARVEVYSQKLSEAS